MIIPYQNVQTMERLIKKMQAIALITVTSLFTICGANAQDKVTASLGADIVSGYIWRGQDLGNVSIQPSVSIGYKGLSLTGWGSVGFDRDDTKEFDLTLGYSFNRFIVSITDYWFNNGAGYFHYGTRNTAHVFEAQIGYDFGFLAANWYTNFAGNDGRRNNGKRAYSSYINLSAPFQLGGLDWTAGIGATPWETSFYNGYANGFEVTDIMIGASKTFDITSRYSLSLFTNLIWNPATEGAYFVLGTSF